MNPTGLIPTLETPDGPIFETAAILLWLADHHGGLGPAPLDADRGDFLKWLFYTSNTLHPLIRMLFYPDKFIAANHIDALNAGLAPQILAGFEHLDAVAQSKPRWLNSDTPSVLDFYVAALLRWPALYPKTTNRDWFDLTRYLGLRDIAARIEALPCCAALQLAEGLGETPFTNPQYPSPPEGSAT